MLIIWILGSFIQKEYLYSLLDDIWSDQAFKFREYIDQNIGSRSQK